MITIQQKALAIIEAAVIEIEGESQEISSIYKAAHVANGRCEHHPDWVAWIENTYAEMVRTGEWTEPDNPAPAATVTMTLDEQEPK